jgi:hypothetical protein
MFVGPAVEVVAEEAARVARGQVEEEGGKEEDWKEN